MKTYLIWTHEDKRLYEFESEQEYIQEAAHQAVTKLLGGCFENTEIRISISADNGASWSLFNFELCMHPRIYETKFEPDTTDPRPKPRKL